MYTKISVSKSEPALQVDSVTVSPAVVPVNEYHTHGLSGSAGVSAPSGASASSKVALIVVPNTVSLQATAIASAKRSLAGAG